MRIDTTARQNLKPLLLMAAVALVFTVWQHAAWARDRISLPEYICQMLGGPIMSIATSINEVVRDTGRSVFLGGSLAAENRRLRQERDELLREKILLTEYFRENKAFREKLGFELDQQVKDIPARVVGRTSASGEQRCRIYIRVPLNREIHKGDIVRDAAGLVGRVIEVKGKLATVLLVIDPQHGLGARVQRSRVEGVIKPAEQWHEGWPDRLSMQYLRHNADIRIGDVIITSGQDGIYPAAIPVGVVEAVDVPPEQTQTVVATIRPFVDFQRLEYVWVIPQP